MDLLQQYDFTDCLLINLEVHHQFRTVIIFCETHLPLEQDQKVRHRGWLRVTTFECCDIHVVVGGEMWTDLDRPYNYPNTLKANEIAEFSVTNPNSSAVLLNLVSDMLQLTVRATRVAIESIPEPV